MNCFLLIGASPSPVRPSSHYKLTQHKGSAECDEQAGQPSASKAVKQSTVLSRSEPPVLESTKYVSAVTTPPGSLKASACKNGTTMDSKVTGFKATDSSLSSPSLLKQLSSPSPTFRSSYTLTIKPRWVEWWCSVNIDFIRLKSYLYYKWKTLICSYPRKNIELCASSASNLLSVEKKTHPDVN